MKGAKREGDLHPEGCSSSIAGFCVVSVVSLQRFECQSAVDVPRHERGNIGRLVTSGARLNYVFMSGKSLTAGACVGGSLL